MGAGCGQVMTGLLWMPVPLRLIDCVEDVLLRALSARVRVALAAPAATGVKLMKSEQSAPAERVDAGDAGTSCGHVVAAARL